VGAQAVVAAADDVDRTEVVDRVEAATVGGRVADALLVDRGGDLEQDRPELVVDRLVVVVLRLVAEGQEHAALTEVLEDLRVEESDTQRERDVAIAVGVDVDLEALCRERGELGGGEVAGLDLELELTVDLRVDAVAHGGELVGDRRVDVRLVPGV